MTPLLVKNVQFRFYWATKFQALGETTVHRTINAHHMHPVIKAFALTIDCGWGNTVAT